MHNDKVVLVQRQLQQSTVGDFHKDMWRPGTLFFYSSVARICALASLGMKYTHFLYNNRSKGLW